MSAKTEMYPPTCQLPRLFSEGLGSSAEWNPTTKSFLDLSNPFRQGDHLYVTNRQLIARLPWWVAPAVGEEGREAGRGVLTDVELVRRAVERDPRLGQAMQVEPSLTIAIVAHILRGSHYPRPQGLAALFERLQAGLDYERGAIEVPECGTGRDVCPWCSGPRALSGPDADQRDCEECDNTRSVRSMEPIALGGAGGMGGGPIYLAAWYAAMLKREGAKLILPKGPKDPIGFAFVWSMVAEVSGGRVGGLVKVLGFVMPMDPAIVAERRSERVRPREVAHE